MSVIPGLAATRTFAEKRLPPSCPEPASMASLLAVRDAEALFVPVATRLGPLLPTLGAAHDALRAGGLLVVSDLVWQTAPTPDLLRAFAPIPGAEKLRPIEGYEMQIEHSGFEVVERVDLAHADWVPDLIEAQQAAVRADARGAVKFAAWLLRRSD